MSYTGLVELKPCPFCGAGARRSLAQPKNGPNNYAIGCSKCIIMTEWRTVEDEAIAAWNTRPDAIEALTRPVDVDVVARAIWRSLTTDVEHDVRANEVTPAELRKIAQAALAAMEAPHADG